MRSLAILPLLLSAAVSGRAQLYVGLEDASLAVKSTDLAGFPDVDWADHPAFEVNGMAASPDGVLYICNGPFTTHLHRYDPAGGSTDLGTVSVDIHGLGYGNGVLYGFSNFSSPMGLYSIDTDTGVATLAVNTSGPGYRYFGLDYNPDDDLLYGYTEYGSPAGLHAIDPATGTITPVAGSIPAENSQGRGLAVGNGVVYITATRGDDGIAAYAWDLAAGGPWTPFTQPYPAYHNTGGATFIAPPGPRCEVSPTFIDAGFMLAGGQVAGTFTITNAGGAVLSGTVTSTCDGVVLDNADYDLAPGMGQSVGITYGSTVAGNMSCLIDTGSECDPVVFEAAVVAVQTLSGPASACGEVPDPGHQEGAETGFIPDWNNGLVGLQLANGAGHTMALSVYIDGAAVWSGNVDANLWEARETGLDLAAWFDQDIRLWFEVSDGSTTWNEDGSECAWELAFSGVTAGTRPAAFRLAAAPNPFNPSTTLSFALPAAGAARLTVCDLGGRTVAVIHDGRLPAGSHSFHWSPDRQASGLYLAILESAGHRDVQRLLYVR